MECGSSCVKGQGQTEVWSAGQVCRSGCVKVKDILKSSNFIAFGCLPFQQHACVSQRRICSDSCMCCHTEIEVADQTFYLIHSQYTDTKPTSPSADLITPGT